IVPVGPNGQVNISNTFGTADVIADVNGYFTDSTASGGQLLLPVSPVRIKDTRSSADTLGPGGKVPVPVATGPIPTNATAAVLNVTATSTTAPSFFTVYPGAGGAQPLASDLNWLAGSTVPNLVVVKLASGSVSIYNQAGSADAVV